MQRHRFYASTDQFNESQVTLDPDESHHLTRVLRLGIGAHVYVFDGDGSEWTAEVSSAGKREAELILRDKLEDIVESPLRLTLGQALIKGEKFDWVVQKATELGVTRIVPLLTRHSDIRRAEERAGQKLQRWRRVALEAVKQCGRRRLVEIPEPVNFETFCRLAADEEERTLRLFFSEHEGRPLREISPAGISSVALAVASEGGWSDDEIEMAGRTGFTSIHLGGRILRTETAAIVATALAQHLFGDL